MKFRRIIINSVPGKSVVQKFNKDDMRTPLETVVYAMPPFPALTYFFMQFVIRDFAWEKYPKYINGTFQSKKVKNVFYCENGDYVIRSSPYTEEGKWRFHKKPNKAVLPERKKRLILKKVEVCKNANTSVKDDRSGGKVIDIRHTLKSGGKTQGNSVKVDRDKTTDTRIRAEIHGAGKRKELRRISVNVQREPETKVVAECSRRPRLKRK